MPTGDPHQSGGGDAQPSTSNATAAVAVALTPAAASAPLPPTLAAVYAVHRPDSSIFKRGGMKREAPGGRPPAGAASGGDGDHTVAAPSSTTANPNQPSQTDADDDAPDDAAILRAKLDAMHAAWAAPRGR